MTSDLCQTGKYNATAMHLRGNWPCLFDGHAWVCIHHVRTQTIVLAIFHYIKKICILVGSNHIPRFKLVKSQCFMVEVKSHLNPFEASPVGITGGESELTRMLFLLSFSFAATAGKSIMVANGK